MTTKSTTPRTNEIELSTPLVAPEFVIALQEDAQCTLKKYLELIEAPEVIVQLFSSVTDLGFYLAEYDRNPDDFGKDKFDVEGMIVETVNAIAKAGGIFHGAYSYSFPRPGSLLSKVAEEVE